MKEEECALYSEDVPNIENLCSLYHETMRCCSETDPSIRGALETGLAGQNINIFERFTDHRIFISTIAIVLSERPFLFAMKEFRYEI